MGEVQPQKEGGCRGESQPEQRENAFPWIAFYPGGWEAFLKHIPNRNFILKSCKYADIWKETFVCLQAIAQKGFDERHAYIGGMFG